MDQLHYLAATEIVRRIRAREVSVEEIVRSFLERIRKYNPRINAVTDLRSEAEIIREAREKDNLLKDGVVPGDLYGLPMTVKDCFMVRGLKNSNGHPGYKNHVATEDAELVKRLKGAGAIIMGKTNLPLFSIDWQSTNAWNGRTNNPYDTGRVPGGSSGGSAAAVAMGFSPLELGSDAGGSIRMPAHFCGICGIRPTEQALSNRGQFKFPGKPQGHRLLTVAGPLAKNTADLLLAMKVLWDNGKMLAEIPPVDFNASSYDGGKLRIAYSNTLNGIEVDEEYQAIFSGFIRKLERENHALETSHPVYDELPAYRLHGKFLGFEVAASSPAPLFLTRPFMYLFILLKYRDAQWARGVAQGVGMSPRLYMEALDAKEKIADIYTAFFDRFDIWLTPVASTGAFKHQRAGKPFVVNGKKVSYTEAMGGFNFTTALSGHPVVVIPIGQTSNGMPVGVQIHASKWNDKRLLETAEYLERFTDGFKIPPWE